MEKQTMKDSQRAYRIKNKEKIRQERKLNAKRYVEYRKKYILNNPNKVKEQQKRWYRNNLDKMKAYQKKYGKAYREKNIERYREYQKEYQKEYIKSGITREKHLLRKEAHRKLRDGIIKLRKCCKICKSTENLEIHHERYINKPKYIILLCNKCHKELHRQLNKQGGLNGIQ